VPFLTQADAGPVERTLFWQHENHAAVREGNWKLVTANDRDPTAWELYDLSSDRSESEDLSSRHGDVAKRLAEKWRRWAEQSNVVPYPEHRDGANPIPWPPREWGRSALSH